jgi:MoaA/NifB/PqqE/SkfB family radical SAM enzyme
MSDYLSEVLNLGASVSFGPASTLLGTDEQMSTALDHRQFYRLPWSLPDNAIAWLEATRKCNLACQGCYRANVNEHKSLEDVAADLDVFERYRSADGVSIAGGDPLTHPQIADIVRMIAQRGWKPILNTNGHALDERLLQELKSVGLYGLTFHIDSKQGRPKWKGKTEQEHNELRLQYAQMVANVGGLSCAFNSTVFGDTLDAVPDMVEWAQKHIDIVHVMVFICYRAATLDAEFDYLLGDRKVDMSPLVYSYTDVPQRADITAHEVVAKIRERLPDFAPCAYLNGTERPDAFKWLLSFRLGTSARIYGYVGPKLMELAQTWHHLTTGRYMAYTSPSVLRRGKSLMWLWPFDRGLRQAFTRAAMDPRAHFRRIHGQSIMVIQPIDILQDGRQSMCDGCPDMTVWDGKLAWSCRLEECMNFGGFVRTVPKQNLSQSSEAEAR